MLLYHHITNVRDYDAATSVMVLLTTVEVVDNAIEGAQTSKDTTTIEEVDLNDFAVVTDS